MVYNSEYMVNNGEYMVNSGELIRNHPCFFPHVMEDLHDPVFLRWYWPNSKYLRTSSLDSYEKNQGFRLCNWNSPGKICKDQLWFCVSPYAPSSDDLGHFGLCKKSRRLGASLTERIRSKRFPRNTMESSSSNKMERNSSRSFRLF